MRFSISMSRRRISIHLIAISAMLVASIVFIDRAADAYTCGGDPWADGTSWEDNQWWGDDCADTHGEMLRMVQLIINETSTGQGCWTGTPDGWWGSNTKTGVICFQNWKGLTADGIVGDNTWGQRGRTPYTGLMAELNYEGGNSNWVRYDLDLSGGYLRAAMYISTGNWYVVHHCSGYLEYEAMEVGGPYSGCW